MTGRDLAAAQRQLEAAKSAYPFNSEQLVAATNTVNGLTGGLKVLKEAEEELFGSNSVEEANLAPAPTIKGKRSKAKTPAGIARAAAAGLAVDNDLAEQQ